MSKSLTMEIPSDRRTQPKHRRFDEFQGRPDIAAAVFAVDAQLLESLDAECIRTPRQLEPEFCRLLVLPPPLVLRGQLPEGARLHWLR